MAKINNISFNNFRNFSNYTLSFNKKLNIFFGKNGSGKTNILEGISLIAKGRGIRNSNIQDLIKRKEYNFFIKNSLEIQNDKYDIKIFLENKNDRFKKIVKINDDLSRDSLNFLNQSISYLIFLPEMERLFQSSPSYRRNFLDRLIFSYRNDYNKLINKYKKYLIERIKILQNNKLDEEWLSHIEKEICLLGFDIYQSRYFHLNTINENINFLKKEHGFQFNVHLEMKDDFFYKNLILDDYLSKLKNSRFYDKQYGGTKIGPHRSDMVARINDEFDASLLSTGQQKTVVLMILLAQCNFLVKYKNINPILLFDEIASHLDSNNRQILLDMINKFDIQFFLTGTDKNLFSFVSTNAQFYNINEL
mgnify:CR=1 FL=1